MEDTAYRNATRRRDAIRREMAGLEDELGQIDQFLGLYEKFSATEAEHKVPKASGDADLESAVKGNGKVKAPKRTNVPTEELRGIVAELLSENLRPMTRGQIVKALAEQGIDIGGSKPNRNMGTIMWRMSDTFTNLEGHGYWPRELPFHEAGYSPPDGSESETQENV